ncbi:MAG: D-2-hydroxyacid dehydrogenase [Candidatus Pelagadaptatus aseana]|uniref:D-2-hydroxyacid dehydrogenase n=1 Tax=Candidatus Pelagadaptatus aseana TaxID=3120508 RepID=UPI0039B25606
MNALQKLVVTDGYTLNPGDLSWSGFEPFGDLVVYDRTEPEQVVERCLGATMVLTNKVILDRQLMMQLPELRYIGVLATGYNVVDLEAARELGVVVTNIPAYGPESVAQFVFALLLNQVQPIHYYSNEVNNGRWSKSPDFCFYDHSMPELAGLTMGIIGYGAIGQKVARIARGFDMKVLVHTRTPPEVLPEGVSSVSLSSLCQDSDVISLHCPLTKQNQGLIDQAFLKQMKSSAYLINTARGPLVNEAELAEALQRGEIAGAALDVLAVEPPPQQHVLIDQEKCTITPHIAWSTLAARGRLMNIAVANVAAFLSGRPQHVVNA